MATATAAPSVPDPSILEKIQDNLITSVQTKEVELLKELFNQCITLLPVSNRLFLFLVYGKTLMS